MKPFRVVGLGVALLLAWLGCPAHAGLTQAGITSPGGFVQAGATDLDSTNGGHIIAGQDLQVIFGAPNADLHEASFSGINSATTSAALSIGTINNSASATASLGQIKLYADNSNGILDGAFPGGRSHGGYKDTLTITSPGLNGQSGFFVFTVNVSGTLNATGANGSAGVFTAVYKDGGSDLKKNALWDPGNSDLISTDRQRAQWKVSTFASGENETRIISDTITMSVPITYGTPFELGFYASARGSTRSQASASSGSTALVNFLSTLDYGGPDALVVGSNMPVNDYSISSLSGFDWNQPVPEPGALTLIAAAGISLLRRRKAR